MKEQKLRNEECTIIEYTTSKTKGRQYTPVPKYVFCPETNGFKPYLYCSSCSFCKGVNEDELKVLCDSEKSTEDEEKYYSSRSIKYYKKEEEGREN